MTLAASCTDLAGKTAHASYPVNIDTTPPKVRVLGVSARRIYVLGAPPRPRCQTTDALSGVGRGAVVKVSTTGSTGVGTFTATCSGALDNAGNHQTAPVHVSYTVAYGFGSGSLKPGQTIPKSRHAIVSRAPGGRARATGVSVFGPDEQVLRVSRGWRAGLAASLARAAELDH